jgi:poly-gamma-glutamate synthesis protein (capsule biosynthesis protein)
LLVALTVLQVAAAGDVQLATDPRAQLAGIARLVAGDVRFVNLEGPITSRGAPSGLDGAGHPNAQIIRFAARPAAAGALGGMVDVVSLANNHALDQGEAGRADTATSLEARGIAAVWAEHDALLDRGGTRVVVIARDLPNPIPAAATRELTRAVARARERGVVLVSLHWGRAGSLLPMPDQRTLAAKLVRAGASLILGHGPHSLQGVERRGGAIIAYSLGNFALGCHCSSEGDAFVLEALLEQDGRVARALARPIRAGLGGAPPTASADAELRNLIADLSRDLGTRASITPTGVEF